MKKLSTLLMAVVLFLTSCDKEKVVSPNDIPATSNNYVTTHFAGQKIVQAIKDVDDLRTTYKVYLDNGTKLEFNKSGDIIDIESNEKLPDSVIPSTILSYVNTNYSSTFIKEWELDSNRQEVKLSNGLTLEFDRNGSFLRIDD